MLVLSVRCHMWFMVYTLIPFPVFWHIFFLLILPITICRYSHQWGKWFNYFLAYLLLSLVSISLKQICLTSDALNEILIKIIIKNIYVWNVQPVCIIYGKRAVNHQLCIETMYNFNGILTHCLNIWINIVKLFSVM